jgi:hypothetical protein
LYIANKHPKLKRGATNGTSQSNCFWKVARRDHPSLSDLMTVPMQKRVIVKFLSELGRLKVKSAYSEMVAIGQLSQLV